MKIMLIGTCLGVGGAERVVCDLADELVSNGHDVLLVSVKGETLLRPDNATITVITLKAEGIRSGISAILRLKEIVRDFRPDVVHTHLFHAIILGRILQHLVYIPRLVSTVHSTHTGGMLRRLMYRFTRSDREIITCVSKEVAESFAKGGLFGSGRHIVVHNGIPTAKFERMKGARESLRNELGIDRKDSIIVSIGRLEEAKDIPNLLLALNILDKRSQSFVSVVVGDGNLRVASEALSAKLKLNKRVIFLGVRSDITRILSACDVFVLSSAWEGLPRVVGEAMACGCIVVSTDAGGVRELLGDGGVIVPVRNPEALADGLEIALGLSPDDRRRLEFLVVARVHDKFSQEAAATRWISIYEQV